MPTQPRPASHIAENFPPATHPLKSSSEDTIATHTSKATEIPPATGSTIAAGSKSQQTGRQPSSSSPSPVQQQHTAAHTAAIPTHPTPPPPPKEGTQVKIAPPPNPHLAAKDAQHDFIHKNILPYLDWDDAHPDPVHPYSPVYLFIHSQTLQHTVPGIAATARWVSGYSHADDGGKRVGQACLISTKEEYDELEKWVLSEGQKRGSKETFRLKPSIFWLTKQGNLDQRVSGLISDLL